MKIISLQKNKENKLAKAKGGAKRKAKGFTIVETLVAIAILMIAIAGPLTIASKGLIAATYAHDQVVASYLAQDNVEYIKNVRDNNLLNNRPWLDKLSNCISSATGHCSVDTITGNPNASAGSATTAGINVCVNTCLLYISGTGYTPNSNVSGGSPTRYSRYFYIEQNSNTQGEARLVVTVSWNNGQVTNAVTYEAELFNIIK